jgi:two-component system sensor histidine kinase UhpB
MKLRSTYLYIFLLGACSFSTTAQDRYVDSLKGSLATEKADSNKVNTLISLSNYYELYSPDSSFIYAQLAINLAEKLHYDKGIFWAAAAMDGALIFTGNYPLELDCAFKALALSKKLNTPRTTGYANGMLSDYYYNLGDYATSLSYWREVINIVERWFPNERANVWGNLSRIYDGMDQHDSAMVYARKTFEQIKNTSHMYSDSNDSLWMMSITFTLLGNAFAGLGDYDSAIFYYHIGIPASINLSMRAISIDGYNGIASSFKAKGNLDSAVWYAEKVLTAKIVSSYPVSLLKAANLLSAIYEIKGRPDSALKYLHKASAIKDSLFSREKMIAIQNLTYKEQEKQQEIAGAEIRLQHRFALYFLLGGFIILLVAGGIILRNKRQKQLQNMRNSIADDLHDDIGSTLSSISIMSELAREKSPQAQTLLASIGESTHIIQENMSDIIWTVKPGNDRFENILQRMNEFASEILDAKNIAFEFISDAAVPASRLNMEQRKNFYLFFKEAINNAAKHSGATSVSVHISQKDGFISMHIKDNGRGFDSSEISGGNGMNTLKKRAEGLHAEFTTVSSVSGGTIVQLSFTIT